MTEERKKYLASISREEKVIRFKIIEQKARIKSEKFWLNHVECNKEQIQQTCWRIYCIKTIIKNLKKQLPAPIVEAKHEHLYSYQCPICKAGIVLYNFCYCSDCGQKLR